MMEFSLFYFADDGDAEGRKYRLLLEGAAFADQHGFAAVWTPERHFHRFGGLFPNPSVTAAAVAATTTRIHVRAGSVVVALHHPLRVAEEWSVVDNISGGRVGISLASGWNPEDFVFAPDAYEERRRITIEAIDTLRKLWRGEPYLSGRDGEPTRAYRIYPRPVQPELPVWLTCGGSPETFRAAGAAGVGVLTNLLTYGLEDLAGKVAQYRAAFAASGWPGRGHVTLMMHAYLDDDLVSATRQVRGPLEHYLVSALHLNLRASGLPVKPPRLDGSDNDARSSYVVQRAVDRYLHSDGLFGSVAQALSTVDRIRAADVDEVACLIDFGVPVDAALASLERLDKLRQKAG
jgi:natural product biosynthesis luciferase-like monooxygenase protein